MLVRAQNLSKLISWRQHPIPVVGWPQTKSALSWTKTWQSHCCWGPRVILFLFGLFLISCARLFSGGSLLRTPSLPDSSKSLLLTMRTHNLGTRLPQAPASPGGSQTGLRVPQDGTRPQGEGQQLSELVAASGQSWLSRLMETCSLFPFFSLAEHFLAGEPKQYLPAFAKTSRESKAGK